MGLQAQWELTVNRTFAGTLLLIPTQKVLAGSLFLLPPRTLTLIILLVPFSWSGLRKNHILGTLVLFHWPFSLSEAILGLLTTLVVSGYLNLRSYTTSFLPHSLDQNKYRTKPRFIGRVPSCQFWWESDKVSLQNSIWDKICHCSPLWKYSLSYHCSICCLIEFYRPYLGLQTNLLVSSFNLFISLFLKKIYLKIFFTLILVRI